VHKYTDKNGTEIKDGDFLIVAYLPPIDATGYYTNEVIVKENKDGEIEIYDYCNISIFGTRKYEKQSASFYQLDSYYKKDIQILGNIKQDFNLLEHKEDLPHGVYGDLKSILLVYGYDVL